MHWRSHNRAQRLHSDGCLDRAEGTAGLARHVNLVHVGRWSCPELSGLRPLPAGGCARWVEAGTEALAHTTHHLSPPAWLRAACLESEREDVGLGLGCWQCQLLVFGRLHILERV